MSATGSLTKTTEIVEQWCKIFPRQATETYSASVVLMRQLSLVALSTITYLKNIFSEDNYTVDQFGGHKLRVLKRKCEDDVAQFLSTSMTHAFEALEKKYLDEIALCFYEVSEEEGGGRLLEYYVFEFSYAEPELGAGSVSLRSARGPAQRLQLGAAARDTLQMLRACMAMHTAAPRLPDDFDIILQLYYNDAAPAGYQAPGFAAAARDPLGARRGAALLGSVRTRWHALRLLAHCADCAAPPDTATSREAVVSSQSPPPESPGAEGAARCGRVEPARLDDRNAAVFRRAVYWLRSLCGAGGAGGAAGAEGAARVSAAALGARLQLSARGAERLLALLLRQRLLRPDTDTDYADIDVSDPSLSVRVDEAGVAAALRRLGRERGDELLRRLVLEAERTERTEPTERGEPGELAAPLARVDLRAAAADATLREYRAALRGSPEPDELPLSGSHNPVSALPLAPAPRPPAPRPPAAPAASSKRGAPRGSGGSGVRNKRAKTTR